MWINALSAFAIEFAEPLTWEAAFATCPAMEPAVGQREHIGFALLEESGSYVDSVKSCYAFQVVVTERVLPKEAIEREIRKRAPANKAGDGEGSDDRASWDQVEAELLARAPVRERRITAVYDHSEGSERLFVFGASKLAEDYVLRVMRDVLGSVIAKPIVPHDSVSALMTRWVKEGAAPTPLLLGRSAEFQSEKETSGKAVFRNRDLSDKAIRKHIEDGDTVIKLGLLWNGELEFTLTAKGEIKSIAPPECKMKPHHIMGVWPEVMEKLPRLLADVMELLGGQMRLEVKERPIRVAILTTGPKEERPDLMAALNSIASKRNITEVVLPAIDDDLQRRVYGWAHAHDIEIVLVRPASDDTSELAHEILKHKPKAALLWGACERVVALNEAAAAHKVPVLQMDRAA